MTDYKKLYYMMFNKTTEIIEELKKLQRDVEEEYLKQGEKEPAKIISIVKK